MDTQGCALQSSEFATSLSIKSRRGPQRQLQSFNTFQSIEVMLRNLPNNYTRSMLLNLLEKQGFVGRFDFLCLVIQWSSHISCAFAHGNCTFLNKSASRPMMLLPILLERINLGNMINTLKRVYECNSLKKVPRAADFDVGPRPAFATIKHH